MPHICIIPAVDGIGGMASFRLKFEAGLKARGIRVTHQLEDAVDAVLVIAGTRDLPALWRAKRRGLRLFQRLDGINWVHRKKNTGLRHFLRAEYGNFVLSLIRSRLATHILYQSEFSHLWWDDWYGHPMAPSFVIHNGVDLKTYNHHGGDDRPKDRYRLLVVEGNLGGGYDMGLENAIRLAETLQDTHQFPVELMVAGRISDVHKDTLQAKSAIPLLWAGLVEREQIPWIDRSAHLLFSADLNPACPNSVIEAMACGLPVVAFDTGALSELVIGDSGRLVPYGGNPWKLGTPDIPALADAAAEVLNDQPRFRQAARAQAEKALGLEKMMDGYLKILLES